MTFSPKVNCQDHPETQRPLFVVEDAADDAVGLPPVRALPEGEAQLLRVLAVLGDLAEVAGGPAEPAERNRRAVVSGGLCLSARCWDGLWDVSLVVTEQSSPVKRRNSSLATDNNESCLLAFSLVFLISYLCKKS